MATSKTYTYLGLLLAGALLFWIADATVHLVEGYTRQTCEERYSFINKEVVCADLSYSISKTGYAETVDAIRGYIEDARVAGTAAEVAVYFRDLHQGPTFGINETADFSPASLLKMPLAMLYYSKQDENKDFFSTQPTLRYTLPAGQRPLEERMQHPSSLNITQNFPPPDEIVEGQSYTVEELLYRLLAYSDNKANELLAEHALATLGGEEAFVDLYRDLGLVDSESFGDEVITVRNYTAMFRLLYNGMYLSPGSSEKVLVALSESSFDAGLEAGVPKGVRVAHKFGERYISAEGTQQLHDCGVVYYPGNAYSLCVMTKGDDPIELAEVISTISRMVYEGVEAHKI